MRIKATSKPEPTPKNCLACDTSFIPWHKTSQKFCCYECGDIYRAKKAYAEHKAAGVCLNCGRPPAEASKYCQGCKNRWLERGRRGNWRKAQLKSKYGLSLEQYDQLLADQGGTCFICHKGNQGKLSNHPLAVDHDHTTGRIRGLLCSVCNSKLGWYEGHKEIIHTYLERPPCV